MTEQETIKKIEREQKGALKECWERHETGIQQREKRYLGIEDLPEYLQNMKMYDFEDVVFYAGYIRGLETAKKYIK